jgi:hypothetical protein
MRISRQRLAAPAMAFAAFAAIVLPSAARAEDRVNEAAVVHRAPNAPFTALLGLEVSLIGLSYGPRAEMLWRFGGAGTVSHLRTTIGVLPGPELVFVPIGLGYRAVFRQAHLVQPFLGLGWEAHFFLHDGPLFAQSSAVYLETGLGFAISDRALLGCALSLDWTVAGERGPGIQERVFAGLRF